MTAPLSPDEGGRAALEAARQFITNGIELGFIRMPDPSTPDPAHGTLGKIEAALAALSTPVPEEGLPRGSASAADESLRAKLEAVAQGQMLEGFRQKIGRAVARIIWDEHWEDLNEEAQGDAMRAGEAVLLAFHDAALSAEAGDGVASALPSPLPSQGEPAAWIVEESLFGQWRERIVTEKPEEGPRIRILGSLYTAEALAAERARADELQGLYDAAIQMYRQATDREGRLTVALAAAETSADRAKEALRNALRGIEVAQLGLNRDGVQHAKLKQVEATLRNILKETPHGER